MENIQYNQIDNSGGDANTPASPFTGSLESKPSRIDASTFPHPPRGPNGTPPATLENLIHLLSEGRFEAHFNVIKKRLEIRRHDGSIASMSQVVSFALLHGMGTGLLYQFVDEIAEKRPYNPIKEWINSVPWDGIDRLPAVFDAIRCADDYPVELKEILCRRWLLSAAAAATVANNFKTRGVLTLQGPQGIGKTTFISSLLPAGDLRNDYIKLDHHLDGSNKDSMIGAITHFIVEMGELDSSFRKDIARLKGFLTNGYDKLRRPYAKEESEYPRRTVFAATVNDAKFLIDPTGNSRWWTIAITGLRPLDHIDLQQLYSQLAAMVEQGEPWWLSPKEEALLATVNNKHRVETAIAGRVQELVDIDRIGDPGGLAYTAIEVLRLIGVNNPSNAQCRECGSALRELLGEPTRIKGRDRWRFHTVPFGKHDPDRAEY